MKKYILPLLLLAGIPQFSSALDWKAYDTPENRKYALMAAAGISFTGWVYTWLGKQSANTKLQEREKQIHHLKDSIQEKQDEMDQVHDHYHDHYADQASLQKVYNELHTLADGYESYADLLMQDNLSEEGLAHKICDQLSKDLLSQSSGIYKSTVVTAYADKLHKDLRTLEKKKKELEKAHFAQSPDMLPLLNAQKDLILDTLANAINILNNLLAHITDVEAELYTGYYGAQFHQEHKLTEFINQPTQFIEHLDPIICGSAKINDRYPYRKYLSTLEWHLAKLGSMYTRLNQATVYPFQKETYAYISSTYSLLTTIKKHLMASHEYKLEQQQYTSNCQIEDERRAAKKMHDENVHLRKQEINLREKEIRKREQENQQLRSQLNNLEWKLTRLKSSVNQSQTR